MNEHWIHLQRRPTAAQFSVEGYFQRVRDQLLRQDIADMQAVKVDRTPGFFVNGTPLREFGQAQLKALVEQELEKSATR